MIFYYTLSYSIVLNRMALRCIVAIFYLRQGNGLQCSVSYCNFVLLFTTLFYCISMGYIMLHGIMQHFTALECGVLHHTVAFNILHHYTLLYCTVQYNIALHHITPYNFVSHCLPAFTGQQQERSTWQHICND